MVLGLSACSSGGSSSASGYGTPSDLATKVGCAGYTSVEVQVYVQQAGKCTMGGQTLYLYVFASADDRTKYAKVATDVIKAGAPGYFGGGSTWIINGLDKDATTKAVTAAGGAMDT